MIQTLRDHADDARFGPVIAVALGLLETAKVDRDPEPTPHLQSSRQISDLHAFRKRSGYYKERFIVGLDETIAALAEKDVPIRAGVVETDQGYIAVWLDERDSPLGVMVISPKSPPDFVNAA